MRTLQNGVCWLTAAASAWLGVMFVVLHRAGFEQGAGMAGLFILQSLLALAVGNGRLTAMPWRLMALAGSTGLIWAGAEALQRTVTGDHFEGYAVIIGALLLLQGTLTAASLVTGLFSSSSKVHQFGN